MPFCAENVCMELDEDGTQLYAVGSRSHITLIDSRQQHKSAGTISSIDADCGKRREGGRLRKRVEKETKECPGSL